jgi:two-component sensor histidine kinase
LHAAIGLLDADKGNVQLLDPSRGILFIAAHQGFEQPFLDCFKEVSAADDSACGRALRYGERVVIEDVEADAEYAPFRAIARDAGYRSVQSTPLIGRDGKPLGIISTHFREIRQLTPEEGELLDLHSRLAAQFIERLRRDERIDLLLHEVTHRAKNLLALVQAIARQTVMSSPDDFLAKFDGRIAFLAGGHDLLLRNAWSGADLLELVNLLFAPFADLLGTRIQLSGPRLFLSPAAAQALGMALNELATNAAKHGALSDQVGCVSLNWTIQTNAAGESVIVFLWQERGGPTVTPPLRQGFGSKVITKLTERALRGKAELTFDAAGVSWRFECPIANVTESLISRDGRQSEIPR